MNTFLENSLFFGAIISLLGYELGLILKKKFKLAILNPLLIGVIAVIAVLVLFDIDYDTYNKDICAGHESRVDHAASPTHCRIRGSASYNQAIPTSVRG